MAMSNTAGEVTDYEGVFAEMEASVETHAPGILSLLDAYQRTLPQPATWRPLNAGAVTYATGVSQKPER